MKALDPVCGMSVEPEKAWAKIEHEGTVFYFCSSHCAKVFAEHPEKYVKKAGHVHGGHHHGGHCCH